MIEDQLRASLLLEQLRKEQPGLTEALERHLRSIMSHFAVRILELETKLELERMGHRAGSD